MKFVILCHLVTPHVQPLAPLFPILALLVIPGIYEGESMAEFETISSDFYFSTSIQLIFMLSAILAIWAILPHFANPPMGDPTPPPPPTISFRLD